MVIEDLGVECPSEQPPVIAERLWDHDENVCEGGIFDAHMGRIP
jgi:hypothetical protein